MSTVDYTRYTRIIHCRPCYNVYLSGHIAHGKCLEKRPGAGENVLYPAKALGNNAWRVIAAAAAAADLVLVLSNFVSQSELIECEPETPSTLAVWRWPAGGDFIWCDRRRWRFRSIGLGWPYTCLHLYYTGRRNYRIIYRFSDRAAAIES